MPLVLDLMQKESCGDTLSSYILWVNLKTSIISPCMRPNFNVGNFKCTILSLYGLFLRLIISLVALFWIFSVLLTYLVSCLQKEHGVLFLGADVLATSKQPVNHHVRIHSRYAKLGLATKVTMNGALTIFSRLEVSFIMCIVWFHFCELFLTVESSCFFGRKNNFFHHIHWRSVLASRLGHIPQEALLLQRDSATCLSVEILQLQNIPFEN